VGKNVGETVGIGLNTGLQILSRLQQQVQVQTLLIIFAGICAPSIPKVLI
jgi:3-deoxy-D-manno-octulosonic acid (KDO) 8-phosphate synthase